MMAMLRSSRELGKKTAQSLKLIDICKVKDLKLLSIVDRNDISSMTSDPNLTKNKVRALVEPAQKNARDQYLQLLIIGTQRILIKHVLVKIGWLN